jgi:hypothetical protein
MATDQLLEKNKSMKTKIEIKSILGDVLFESERENNTVKDTLLEAINSGADLSGANLSGAKMPMICKWPHSIVDGKIRIGCKVKSIEEWDIFFNSDEVYLTERNTQDFKQIRAVFESYKAYINVLNS